MTNTKCAFATSLYYHCQRLLHPNITLERALNNRCELKTITLLELDEWYNLRGGLAAKEWLHLMTAPPCQKIRPFSCT